MAEFDAWAELYDTLHPGLPGEARFYVTRAIAAGGPVLELGCGTGRVALAMALSGVDVVGLDLSEAMLDVAADKLEALEDVPGDVELVVGDMRDFDLERVFSFIAMPYRSFMHLHEPEDQLACLESVLAHLAPGGTFIFNTWQPRPSAIATFQGAIRNVDRYPVEETGGQLVHTMSTRADEGDQRLYEEHLIHEVDEDGLVEASYSLTLSRTWTTYRELLHLIARSGFEVVEVLGDFRGEPRDGDSTEMIWVLRAAEPEAD